MVETRQNVNLKGFNTFGIEVYCDLLAEINSIEDFRELTGSELYKNSKKLILGGGSNILFTENFKGLVIKNNIKGIFKISEDERSVIVKAMAGEVWHDFVMWCIQFDYAGLENLSLIPGCVGASPMQNIGAYGVEIKELFEELEALDMETGEARIFKKQDCAFGYRESVFKHQYKSRYIIVSVSFRLQKSPKLNTTYGAINAELENMGVKNPSIKDVSQAVIRIRQSKLPDPRVTGNAGSFFKNPEVTASKFSELKDRFDALVAYPLENGRYKLAAGWLIEQCGLKGYEINGAAVHTKQALVLINKGNAKGEDVLALSTYVIKSVSEKFGVILEREVNIL
ncbi:MAG: UDP-N-acetylmuramate dehydrogenase [Bacteroidia bacterium]|nr:UDP-N-acetylmuramate dehydrogenase [Bacteroidia bacterium]